MKIFLSLIGGVIVGFAAAYLTITKAPASATPTKNTPVAVAPSASLTISAQDSLRKLTELNPTATKDPARVIRQIVHQLECLADIGNPAVGPIAEVLAQGKDLDYLMEENRTPASSLPFWNWRSGQPIFSGLVLPPSFRLALVDVLKSIGTEQAEGVLLVMLTGTDRAVEVAYITQVLEKLSPGKYTAVGLAAAQRLAGSPAPSDATSPLDQNRDAYIYNLLGAHGDNSQVATAQSTLMKDGRLNLDAAKYLVNTMKAEAVPALARVYSTAAAEDQNRIASMTFSYVGASAEANQIFKEWIVNSTQPASSGTVTARPRAAYVQMLAGGNLGPFQAPPPSDPAVIASRIALLNELNSQLPDSALKQTVGQTLQKLKAF